MRACIPTVFLGSRMSMFLEFQRRIEDLQRKPIPPPLLTCSLGHLLERTEAGSNADYFEGDDSFECDECHLDSVHPGWHCYTCQTWDMCSSKCFLSKPN